MSDGELLLRLRSRDAVCLEALYDRHCGFVNGLAIRMLQRREEAEEIVQDVFWQLWKSEIRYDPLRGSLRTWLFAITRSRCLDRLRSRRGPRTAELAAPDAAWLAPENPEDDAYAAERRRRVVAALGALPESQRRVVELGFFLGMTHREIAERLGEPLGTVKSRIRMGIDKLKQSLSSLGESS